MNDYQKRSQPSRKTRNKMVIVCEGEKTEPNYFERYRTRDNNVEVIPITSNKKSDARNVVKKAKNELESLDLKEGDTIWCVFDRDRNTDTNIVKAFKEAGKNIQICFSNPSFEIWFLLHYQYNESPMENEALIIKLKRYFPDYHKSGDYYDELLHKREDAIKHSKKLNKYHEDNSTCLNSRHSNPSTQIYKIIEAIQKFNL